MKIKRSKCEFHKKESEYLGFLISEKRHQSKSIQDTGNMRLDNPYDKEANTVVPRILQLLSTIHRRIQQNSKTPQWWHSEEVQWQMGMGVKGTTSIRQTQKKTHNNTGYGLLQSQGTDQTRNRHFEIYLLRNSITIVWRQEMETSGLRIQNNARRRMQLRYTR